MHLKRITENNFAFAVSVQGSSSREKVQGRRTQIIKKICRFSATNQTVDNMGTVSELQNRIKSDLFYTFAR